MLHLLRTKACLAGRQAIIRTVSLMLCGGILLAQSAAAQFNPYSKVEMNRTDQDSKPYYFGMSLGINLARFQTELHPVFLQSDSVSPSIPVVLPWDSRQQPVYLIVLRFASIHN